MTPNLIPIRMPHETRVFSNGLRVVMEPIPFARSISFGIWVKNGSRDEDESENGISHFIEHMLFKGTAGRTARQIADDMDEVGGQINAFTTKEYTCYYTLTLDEHIDVALDVLSDMFFNSRFAAREVDKERNVILEEISMYEDTPDELAHDILQYQAWGSDPLGRSILGTEKTIAKFGHRVFKNYMKAHYCPGNTVLAVAGHFDPDEMARKLEAHFSRFKAAEPSAKRASPVVYRPCVTGREKDIEQVHISLGFPGVGLKSEYIYEMSVFNAIFGGGMSSRLFQTIREERGLAYSIYSYNSGYSDTGLFYVYAACGREQAKDVISLIFKEADRLRAEPVTEAQLKKTKEQIKSGFILSLESTVSRMNGLGRAMTMLDRVLTVDEQLARIDAVTLDGLYGLIESVLRRDMAGLAMVGDIAGLDLEGMIANEREQRV